MNEAHYEGSKEKIYSVKGRGDTFESVLARRLRRRALLTGAAAAVGGIVVNNTFAEAQDASPVASPDASPVGVAGSLTFTAIEATDGAELVVAEGYTAVPFLAWGDPLFPDAPAFDPNAQTAAGQAETSGPTTTTFPASCRCRLDRTLPTTACWSSITSTPTPS